MMESTNLVLRAIAVSSNKIRVAKPWVAVGGKTVTNHKLFVQ